MEKVQAEAEAKGKPWQLSLDLLELNQFTIAVGDQGVEPTAALDVMVKRLALTDVHTTSKTPMSLQADLEVKQGGSIDLKARIDGRQWREVPGERPAGAY